MLQQNTLSNLTKPLSRTFQQSREQYEHQCCRESENRMTQNKPAGEIWKRYYEK